jgi:GT2 family glycosyltransferase
MEKIKDIEIRELNEQISELKEQIKVLQQEKENYDDKIRTLELRLRKFEGKIRRLRKRNRKHEKTISEIRKSRSWQITRPLDVIAKYPLQLIHYLGHSLETKAGQKKSRKKIVIYSAIAGDYDELKRPEYVSEGCDYVCFSDKRIGNHHHWQIRPFDYYNADPTRTARYVKLHPHVYFPDYEWSIWVDANLLIVGDMADFISGMPLNYHMATFKHPYRDCIYDEASKCIDLKLDKPEIIMAQVNRYRSENYPHNLGLSETNVIVRKHNEEDVIQLMNDWWKEIDNGSKRDQLSLNYVAYKNDIRLGFLAEDGISVRNHPSFRLFRHNFPSNAGSKALRRTFRRNKEFVLEAASRTTPVLSDKTGSLNVDIIVCVHDHLDDVKKCLSSIDGSRQTSHRLIIVDDGSDTATHEFLRSFVGRHSGDILIRHQSALGYTKAANSGLRASTGDYAILLNSDTVVAFNWILKILQCGESASDIGIIGPLSNAASWQSVPERFDEKGDFAVNQLPHGFSVSDMDKLVESYSTIFPRVPLVNGFCLAIKRKVIDKIGYFDEENFPDGYGEENDYCFRATDAGFACSIATHTYVYHAKSQSYTHERRRILGRQGSVYLRQKYPSHRIDNAIETMRFQPILGYVREGIRRSLDKGLYGKLYR